MTILLLLFILIVSIGGTVFFRKKDKTWGEILIFFLYIFSLLVASYALLSHCHQYYEAVDAVDEGYTPFGGKHAASLVFYLIMYHIAIFAVWYRGRRLPPLLLVIFIIFIISGIIINIVNLFQIAIPTNPDYHNYNNQNASAFIFPAIIFIIALGFIMIFKILKMEKSLSEKRHFRNAFLERCNRFLAEKFSPLSWAFIFLLPCFIVVMLILILFGQDYDSLVKVYTETTTWAFSQKMHPPPLDHRGHYLCTVSAHGNPKIVKPLFIGKRHGKPIIVNRQLQIANAFEEMISDFSPKIHRFIRKNYDRYGYNLSTIITTRRRSNLTYILMKPIEWFFLASLYLGCEKPEIKIKKQYNYNSM